MLRVIRQVLKISVGLAFVLAVSSSVSAQNVLEWLPKAPTSLFMGVSPSQLTLVIDKALNPSDTTMLEGAVAPMLEVLSDDYIVLKVGKTVRHDVVWLRGSLDRVLVVSSYHSTDLRHSRLRLFSIDGDEVATPALPSLTPEDFLITDAQKSLAITPDWWQAIRPSLAVVWQLDVRRGAITLMATLDTESMLSLEDEMRLRDLLASRTCSFVWHRGQWSKK